MVAGGTSLLLGAFGLLAARRNRGAHQI